MGALILTLCQTTTLSEEIRRGIAVCVREGVKSAILKVDSDILDHLAALLVQTSDLLKRARGRAIIREELCDNCERLLRVDFVVEPEEVMLP